MSAIRSSGTFSSRYPGVNLQRAFKASGCSRCKRRFPDLDWSELHIHHVDPAAKTIHSAYLQRASADEIIPELLKCEVLCVECHRAEHNSSNLCENQLHLFTGAGMAWREAV